MLKLKLATSKFKQCYGAKESHSPSHMCSVQSLTSNEQEGNDDKQAAEDLRRSCAAQKQWHDYHHWVDWK